MSTKRSLSQPEASPKPKKLRSTTTVAAVAIQPYPRPAYNEALQIIMTCLANVKGVSEMVVDYTSWWLCDFMHTDGPIMVNGPVVFDVPWCIHMFRDRFPDSLDGAIHFQNHIDQLKEDVVLPLLCASYEDVKTCFREIPFGLITHTLHSKFPVHSMYDFVANLCASTHPRAAVEFGLWVDGIGRELHSYGSRFLFWGGVKHALEEKKTVPTIQNIECFWILLDRMTKSDADDDSDSGYGDDDYEFPIYREFYGQCVRDAARVWKENPERCTDLFLASPDTCVNVVWDIPYFPIHYHWFTGKSDCPTTMVVKPEHVPVTPVVSSMVFTQLSQPRSKTRDAFCKTVEFAPGVADKINIFILRAHTERLAAKMKAAETVFKTAEAVFNKARDKVQAHWLRMDNHCSHKNIHNNNTVCLDCGREFSVDVSPSVMSDK